jgi:hypothetical protein
MSTPNILQTKIGPFHADTGRVLSWDSYDVINYPSEEEAPKSFHDIVYDPRKRETWLRMKQRQTTDVQSLQIDDMKARVLPAVRHRFGVEDRFDASPTSLVLDSFLASVVAAWLIYVIIKGRA